MGLEYQPCSRVGILVNRVTGRFEDDTRTSTNNISSDSDDLFDLYETVKLLDGDLVVPGYLELQTNGLAGVHFTTLGQGKDEDDLHKLEIVARSMAENGVTGWWATVPTVPVDRWKKVLPILRPRTFPSTRGSPLLGVHVEGPYLHPSKKGAHNDRFFRVPSMDPYRDVYGEDNLRHIIKMITVAPELPGACEMIRDIRTSFPHIVVALGHSTATFEQGLAGCSAGARTLTHVFNAMNALHHREPGLAGLISSTHSPWFSVIPDLVHLHPSILRFCFLANPDRCILITDSIELAGLADGVYPPNGQITYTQRKNGNRATNVADVSKGEVETLIGSCITLPQCVRNMIVSAGLTLPQAVRCVTENVAMLMRDDTRGKIEAGRRADFLVLDREGNVRQTWIAGELVWSDATSSCQ